MADLIQRESLAHLIAATLENWIFQEKYKPGERLKESHIAKSLGTSQTPVREALRILEEKGLVVHVPDKGASVINLTQEDINQMLSLRVILEPMALDSARQSATPEERNTLKGVLAELGQAAEENDLLKYHLLHMQFHRTVWEIGHNRQLVALLNRVCTPLWAFYRQRVRNKADRKLSGMKTHLPLVEFIEGLYPQTAARQLMENHFNDVAGFNPENILA